jgi:hypothetical protein
MKRTYGCCERSSVAHCQDIKSSTRSSLLHDAIDKPIRPDLGHGLVPANVLVSNEACVCDELLCGCTGVCFCVKCGIECPCEATCCCSEVDCGWAGGEEVIKDGGDVIFKCGCGCEEGGRGRVGECVCEEMCDGEGSEGCDGGCTADLWVVSGGMGMGKER